MSTRWTRKNVLTVAGILGLATGLLVYFYINRPSEQPRTAVAKTTARILKGTVIDRNMLVASEVPASDVSEYDLAGTDEVVGKVAIRDLAAGHHLRRSDFDEVDNTPITFRIPDGMRAVTVGVDPVISVAGFVKPGDRVDVVATYDRADYPTSRTILQNIKLLAIGPRVESAGGMGEKREATASDKDTATLLVTLPQAERLILADNRGKLRLVLRGVRDVRSVETAGAVIGGEAPVRITAQPAVQAPTRMTGAPPENPFKPGIIAGVTPGHAVELFEGANRTVVYVQK